MSEIIRIENIEGNLRVSSRLIAEHFEKRHDSVLRDIENLISNIGSPQNCGSLHEEDIDEKSVDLFKKSTYQHPQNKQWYKEYLINRDGFTLLAMGFTGKKALEWKLKYIEAFNKMEEELRKNNEYNFENLSTEMKAILLNDKKIQVVEKRLNTVDKKFNELPLFPNELKLLKRVVNKKAVPLLGGKNSPAYKSMSRKVFSDIYKQVHREFGVTGCEEIKRKDFELAKEVVEKYELPMVLEEDISSMNGQISFV